jgi:hypothetical protein
MRDEKGNIVPKDEEAFYIERMRDKAKKPNQVDGMSTGAISKMNASSPISRAFRGEHIPNAMSRRQKEREQKREGEHEKFEPIVVEHTRTLQRAPLGESVDARGTFPEGKKHVTVELPEDTQKQLDLIQDSLKGAEKDIVALAQVMKDFLEKSERAKHQDIDALFRNRCANRRTQGFCRLTAKGKLAKGKQLKVE